MRVNQGLLNVLSGYLPIKSLKPEYSQELKVDLVYKGESYVSNLNYHNFHLSDYKKHLDLKGRL